MPEGTISARQVLRVLLLLEQRGHDPRPALASAGLAAEQLRAPGARIPYARSDALVEAAASALADPLFGLQLARTRGEETYDLAGLVLLASPTLGEGLTRSLRFQRLWGDGERFRLARTARGARVAFTPPGRARPAHAPLAECALAEVLLAARFLTGQPVAPLRVRFRHAAPADAGPHQALFGRAPEWGAPQSELELARADLERPLADANARFLAIFERQAEAALAGLPRAGGEGLAARARDELRLALGSGGPTHLAALAGRLSLAARTLQRRLAEQGQSHAALLEAVRRELAEHHLARGAPVGQVSDLLGYADRAAFHRAFKRWTGHSPRGSAGRASAQRSGGD